MRLWTLHPVYLDSRGLVAVWREGLLAQKILIGNTKGYKNHPQLQRFKQTSDPKNAIALYLSHIYQEALRRGYQFSLDKIGPIQEPGLILSVTDGQLNYEWRHLQNKLRERDIATYQALKSISSPNPHPLFAVIGGDIAEWEKIK